MRRAALYRVAAIVLPVLVLGAGCSSDRHGNIRRYPLTGVVIGHDVSPPRIVVAHDRIEGLMPAMTMAFEAGRNPPPARQGQRIVATLVVTDSRSWLEDIKVTGAGEATGAGAPPGIGAAAGVVPAFRLLDQDGRERSLHDFAGRVLIITFIYTRCPLPDFCPLMVQHLESIRHRANAAGMGDRLTLLGVTLDPSFDTPAVLKAYGRSVLKGPGAFDQWTLATGSAEEIGDLAGFFGVGYRPDAGFVMHTLTTVVVDREGRIVRVFPSNSWTPDDLFDVVTQAVTHAAAD